MPIRVANVVTVHDDLLYTQCTDVRFASFLSGGIITVIVVNPPESKMTKCTCVQ